MAKAGALYEQDFFLWTKEQAAALRAGTESSNPPSASSESTANSRGTATSLRLLGHCAERVRRPVFPNGRGRRRSPRSS